MPLRTFHLPRKGDLLGLLKKLFFVLHIYNGRVDSVCVCVCFCACVYVCVHGGRGVGKSGRLCVGGGGEGDVGEVVQYIGSGVRVEVYKQMVRWVRTV